MKKLFLFFSFLLTCISSTKELRRINLHKRALHNADLQASRNLNNLNQTQTLLHKNMAVQADFGEAYYSKSINSDFSNEIFLAIAIASHETGLSASSLSTPFQHFVCDSSYCQEDDSIIKFDSPWIKTTARKIYLNTTISIAGGAWELKTDPLYFNYTPYNQMQIIMTKGWIGLGTGSGANKNFRDENPIFSFLLNQTSSGTGSLIFGFDSTIADIDKPLMAVSSDADWKTQMTSLSFGSIVYSDSDQPVPLIFDIMNRGIFLPCKVFKDLINQMNTQNLTCFGSNCLANDISGLPSLVFGFDDGKNFTLTPKDYMKEADSDLSGANYFSLMIRNIQTHKLYYEDQVILGWDVLANFYSVFQQTDGINTISFYEINSATSSISPPSSQTPATEPLTESSDLSFILVIMGIILVVLILGAGAIIFIIRKNKSERKIETMELSTVETFPDNSDLPHDLQEQSQFL